MFTGISGSKHFFSASSMTFCSSSERVSHGFRHSVFATSCWFFSADLQRVPRERRALDARGELAHAREDGELAEAGAVGLDVGRAR